MVAAQRIAQGSPAFQTTYALDRVAHMTKVSNGRIANDSIRSMLACSNSKLHGVNSLIPVTTQTREYISTLCQEASRIRSLPILPSATPSSPKYPRPDGAVHYHVDEHPIWTDAKAMIISGLETKWEVDWSPSSFASAFARKDCEIEQTVTGTLRTTKVSGFFNDYGKAVKSVEGVWRIKVSILVKGIVLCVSVLTTDNISRTGCLHETSKTGNPIYTMISYKCCPCQTSLALMALSILQAMFP